jgi:hypothetical protein
MIRNVVRWRDGRKEQGERRREKGEEIQVKKEDGRSEK